MPRGQFFEVKSRRKGNHRQLKILISGSNCGPYEKELLKALLHDYERQSPPVLNKTEPVVLTFGVTLQQIIDVVSLFFFLIS